MIDNKKQFNYALSHNFNMFAEQAFKTLRPGENYPYIETIATKLIIDSLLRMERGECNKMLINVPPRSLKSTLISVAFTAWILGQDPTAQVVCISYNDDLAKDFSTATRKVIESDWYKAAFPKTKISPNKNTEAKFETTQNGSRTAISLQGGITGRGGEWIIIDDPQKPDDVLSETIRTRTNKIFDNTLLSRLNNKVKDKIIVVGQRLHVDDFYSHVKKFSTWHELVIPAIAEKDEEFRLISGETITRAKGSVINPKIEPLEILLQMKAGMSDYNFSAQYQQRPVPEKGNIINFEKFILYPKGFVPEFTHVLQSWDIALSTGDNNDYSVCVTAGLYNDWVYILDITRGKWSSPELLPKVKEMKGIYSADGVIVEDSPISKGLIQHLEQDGLSVIKHRPTDCKEARANNQTFKIEAGKVRILADAPWINAFKNEILTFPKGVHDDQVDALIQLLERTDAFQRTQNVHNVIKRRTENYNHRSQRNQAVRDYNRFLRRQRQGFW